jgi:hypothetical protein
MVKVLLQMQNGFLQLESGSIKLQRRSSLNLLGEAGTDFQISK